VPTDTLRSENQILLFFYRYNADKGSVEFLISILPKYLGLYRLALSIRLSTHSSLQVSIISSVYLVVPPSFRLSIHPFSTQWQYTYMELYRSTQVH